MSIKNLAKKIFYLIFIITIGTALSAREEYHWTYNLEKGEKQFAAKMYNDAFDSMRLALRKNPECFQAANVMGHISVLRKDMYSAEKYYTISLNINDLQPDIHTKMGGIDEYFQRDESALAHYNRSISLDPKSQRALINLARINFKSGNNTGAERYFKQCFENGIAASAAIFKKGESFKKNNPAAASAEFKKAIEVNPAHVEAYTALADCYRQLKDYDSAIDVLEELKRNRPDYIQAYIYLGNIYFNNRTGNRQRKHSINLAIMNYERALKLDPENADIYFQLSGIYRMTGNRDRASELEAKGGELLKSGK